MAQAPQAAFSCSNPLIVCTGEYGSYLNQSTNSPTSWQWSFPGATPSSSTQQNPTVQYNTPGTYNVTLIVANSFGSDTITAFNYIDVDQMIPVDCLADTFCSSAVINWGIFCDLSMNCTFVYSPPFTSITQTTTFTILPNCPPGVGLCYSFTNFQVVIVHPPDTTTILQNGAVLTAADPADAYQWYLNGNPIPGANAQSYTATQNGTYTVELTTIMGTHQCSTLSAAYMMTTVGMTGSSFSASPVIGRNGNTLLLQADGGLRNVTVYSIDGKTLCVKENPAAELALPETPGIYLLYFRYDDREGTMKVVVE